jgi:hypothetical protein
VAPPSVADDILWIGGSPCSGKSTVAAHLAAVASRTVYSCDDGWERHAAAATAAEQPVLTKLCSLPADVRLRQPLGIQVSDVVEAYREQFPFILRDLSSDRRVVVEGAALLPEFLSSLGVPPGRAVWLVPTEAFQRAHYGRRRWARDLLAGASDADDLFETWMRRDAAFGRLVALQARDLGYRVITVDGSAPADAVLAEVAKWLSIAS